MNITYNIKDHVPWDKLSLLRQRVLAELQGWLGTKYEHGQRCKGGGVDCGQILLGVYHNAGIIPQVKTDYYPKDFHLHRAEEWYKGLVEQFADEIQESELLPGDLILYRQGRLYSHGAIALVWPEIVHAYRPCVLPANSLDISYHLNPKKFYRPRAFK